MLKAVSLGLALCGGGVTGFSVSTAGHHHRVPIPARSNLAESEPFNPRREHVWVSKADVARINQKAERWLPIATQWSIFGGLTLGGAGAIMGLGSAGVLTSTAAAGLAKSYGATVAAATGWNLLAYRFLGGGHTICQSMKGKLIETNTKLTHDVADTALKAGLPYTPAVYVIPSKEPNAFAAGTTPETSVVAVTSGLLSTLSPQEVKAVIAHEMGHARHHDVGRMMQTAAMSAGFSATLRRGWDLMTSPDRSTKDDDDEDNSWIAGAVLTGVGAATYAAGTLLRLASSRDAEYHADAFADQIGLGAPLASALEKIELASHQVERDALGGSAGDKFAHMYISNEPKHDVLSSMAGWLATHPPTRSRIGRLRGDDPAPESPGEVPGRPGLRSGWAALREVMEDPPAF